MGEFKSGISKVNKPKIESSSNQNIEMIFDHCFEISEIAENDIIPVGGESMFSAKVNVTAIADFENLKDFFVKTRKLAEGYNLIKIEKQLVAQGVNINPEIFAKLIAFSRSYDEQFPYNPQGANSRQKIYEEKDIKISDVFRLNSAECAEISALAQVYLQNESIQSRYFSGEVCWNKDGENLESEAHSFILLEDGDKTYIYDPANPFTLPNGKFPSLYTIDKDFNSEVRQGQKRLVTAKNIISDQEAYFGVNNQTYIDPERHIV
ncbi:MAG: hypothetical protein K9L98_02540 [Candidatus Pacebacteria bacterium]|nr:hypothetical protein [Candidatus Paceibacterota bacterium]MCF7862864.1 hypothetical protein [Candidatus Paceibacterota bacterium]